MRPDHWPDFTEKNIHLAARTIVIALAAILGANVDGYKIDIKTWSLMADELSDIKDTSAIIVSGLQ